MSPILQTLLNIRRKSKGKESVAINKGGRKSKVTFIDEISNRPLAEVFIAESYKYYNSEVYKPSESACCSIFWTNTNAVSTVEKLRIIFIDIQTRTYPLLL